LDIFVYFVVFVAFVVFVVFHFVLSWLINRGEGGGVLLDVIPYLVRKFEFQICFDIRYSDFIIKVKALYYHQ
jgi:hypothetical protein